MVTTLSSFKNFTCECLLKIDALSKSGEFYYLSRQFLIYLTYAVYVFVEVCSFKINLLPWLLQDAWLLKVHIFEVEGSFSGPNISWIAGTLCNVPPPYNTIKLYMGG